MLCTDSLYLEKVEVAYSITFEPIIPIVGLAAHTVIKRTAVATWTLVQKLEANKERVVIQDAFGREIGRGEIQRLATKEMS